MCVWGGGGGGWRGRGFYGSVLNMEGFCPVVAEMINIQKTLS